jgi:hypothetical protein
MNTFPVMFYWRGHEQFVMRCGFLLVEGCMVTCKKMKEIQILLLSLVHLHLLQGDAGGRESVLQGEQ